MLEPRLGALLSSLSAEAGALASRVRAGVVVVRGRGGGQGSGVIWHADGVVLTNDHVVARDAVRVILEDGRDLPATVFRRDPVRDLAALRLPVGELPAVPVADSRGLRPGELVIAAGNPLGVRGAVAVGVFGSIVRNVDVGHRRLPEMVQAAVDLYPGNSGGPLVDARGGVVGINSMVLGRGVALAVPSHVARAFLADELPRRAYLGVSLQPVALPEALAERLGLRGTGLLVAGVAEGSPAERAGLLLGDLLVGLNGGRIASAEDLRALLAAGQPGVPTPIRIIRGGEPRELSVTVDRQTMPGAA